MTVFKMTIDQFNDTVQVEAFGSKHEASQSGNAGLLVATETDLSSAVQITGPLLLSIYNSMAEFKLKKFETREIGVKRTWELLQATLSASKPNKEPKGAVPEKKAVKVPKEKKTHPVASKTSGKPKGTRRAGLLVLKPGTANPYRVGTISFKAFDLVEKNPGKTFAEIVTLGAKAGVISEILRHGLAKIEKKTETGF